MSTLVADRVDTWDDRPFEGGYRELHDLADREFSGVVRAGGAELYMTKGTVVGVRQGTIKSFEGATGTAYEAPTPALPLLAVMQDRSDEVRAKYYTEETSISTVDGKLADGNFTGFIELSENVLSGDYYLVYHQGHSMSVAFVGESARLIDGDEAFQQADGEVGIYEVRPVEINVVEIPEPAEPEPDDSDAGAAAGASTAAGAETTEDGTDDESEREDDTAADEQTGDERSGGPSGAETTETEEATGAGEPTEQADAGDSPGRDDPHADPPDQSPPDRAAGRTAERAPGRSADERSTETAGTEETTATRDADEPARTESGTGGSDTDARGSAGGRSTDQDRSDTGAGTGGTSPSSETGRQQSAPSRDAAGARRGRQQGPAESEPGPASGGTTGKSADQSGTDGSASQQAAANRGGRALETRAIPSLDPGRTETADNGGARADAPKNRQAHQTAGPQRTEKPQAGQPQAESQPEPEPEPATEEDEPGEEPSETAEPETAEVDPDRIAELEAEIDDREAEIDRLESQLDSVSDERDDLREKLQAVREERDDLAEEVDRLETELEQLETEFGAATDAERRMTPREALDGTDIFVRYESKGDATLAKAHDGGIRRSDVDDNLRLEKHTQFDADAVAVGGQTFTEFLEDTLEFQFVKWVIRELLFEIRDTGHSDGLRNLFDAIPKIDRAELNGAVNVVYTEEGQETRTTEAFDVVLRDRMGDPLLVANLNDSREAATESDMENLVTAAERVGQTSDDFSAAFLVTRSFFEPGALETASEATRGGLLSRDKRRSFVNLSRKRGYHLCLVEARNRNFNLAVPEL